MRKAILIAAFLLLASLAGAQSPKRKTASPKKTVPISKGESACGQQIPTFDQFLEETKVEWRGVIESEDATLYYNTRKTVCDEAGILHVWIKAVEKHSQTTLNYSIIKYELKCRADQFRMTSATGYDSAGRVVNETNPDNPKWKDALPDSVMEGILEHVCRHKP